MWNQDRSRERIAGKLADVQDLEISDLSKEIDFENISLLHPRRVIGAHLYFDVSNFQDILGRSLEEETEPEVLRLLEIYFREAARMVSEFGLAKVHFQGTRLHAVSYLPIKDEETIAARAVLLTASLKSMVEEVLNPAFPDEGDFVVGAGIDYGETIATKNNVRGDRELLFLGVAANTAAKIVPAKGGAVILTSELATRLPTEFDDLLDEIDDERVSVDVGGDVLVDLLSDFDLSWSLDVSKDRIAQDLDAITLDDVGLSAVREQINKNKLSLKNSKSVSGVNFFADVDGFSAYIAASQADDGLVEAIQAYHVIRSEMRYVTVEDYQALRVQYQGDRVQGLGFKPVGDEDAYCLQAVELASGLHASASITLPEKLPEDAIKALAIGMATGPTLVSKLGERGRRDVLCVGPATEAAASYQVKLDGGETGISKSIRDALPADVGALFKWVADKDCYVARDLRPDQLELLAEGQRLDQQRVTRTTERRPVAAPVRRPWSARP